LGILPYLVKTAVNGSVNVSGIDTCPEYSIPCVESTLLPKYLQVTPYDLSPITTGSHSKVYTSCVFPNVVPPLNSNKKLVELTLPLYTYTDPTLFVAGKDTYNLTCLPKYSEPTGKTIVEGYPNAALTFI
jgi:hypothetical protein